MTVPAAATSPGRSSWSLLKVPGLTVRLELGGPATAPSLTLIAVVSALVRVVAKEVEERPLAKVTAVV